MEKMKMHSPNLTQENIARIRKAFPGCVTEDHDENGKVRLAVDFDLLRQELSDSIVEGPQERYHLNWPGKREALLTANAPIAKTMRPCREESVDFDTTKNLFIEGDNLDALKHLQETYLGMVKMIYIDPPYNTGRDFVYKDDFAENNEEFLKKSNQKDENGNPLVANTESNGRFHSDWLSMIYPRLRLAKNLLRDDGVIFISIDDGEMHNIKHICCEIFGENNFLGTILWKKKTNGNNMGYIPPVHDYIVCFAKSASGKCILGFPLAEEYVEKTYSNPDNDPRGPWTTSDLSANHVGPYFEIINPNTGKAYLPPQGRYWVFNETEVKNRIEDGRIIFGKNGKSGPVQKKHLNERASNRIKPESWWDKHGLNEDGTEELSNLFIPKVYDHPKPTKLLKKIIDISTTGNDLILDFFAGSGSTAHAVLAQNASDGAQRRYICVQLDEKCNEKSVAFNKCQISTISELCKERIRRASKTMLDGECHQEWNKDVGFRVLKIDTSNMEDVYYAPDEIEQGQLNLKVDNVKPDRTFEDLLFQVLLDWGVDLTLPIRKEKITIEKSDKNPADSKEYEVFFVDENALIACFDHNITENFVKELTRYTPLRVVFRDAGFVNDAARINVEQIFKQMSPGTEVKTI